MTYRFCGDSKNQQLAMPVTIGRFGGRLKAHTRACSHKVSILHRARFISDSDQCGHEIESHGCFNKNYHRLLMTTAQQ